MKPPGAIFTFWEALNATKASAAFRSIPKQTLHSTNHVYLHKPFTSPTSTFHTIVETLLGGGIFRTVRSVHTKPQSKVHSINLRSSSRFDHPVTRFNKSSITPATSRTLFSSRLRAPSVPFPTNTTNKGLGNSRNFSSGSGRSFYQNIVENVPFNLRILGDQGIDDRKWKKECRRIRRSMRTKVTMKMDERERNLGMPKEFNNYFGRAVVGGLLESTLDFEEGEEVKIDPASQDPITLVIYLEPDFNTLSDYLDDSSSTSSQFRLFQPSPIETMQTLYNLHSNKLESMFTNLRNAGVFDDEENVFDWTSRKGELKITFGKDWEKRDVQQAVGDYSSLSRDYTSNTSKGFYEILGSEVSAVQDLAFSTCPSSPTHSGSSCYENEDHHNLIASSFYLPSPGSITTSPYYSTPDSSHLEQEEEEEILLASPFSSNGWEDQGSQGSWDFGRISSQPFVAQSPSMSVVEESYRSNHPSTMDFKFDFEEEEESDLDLDGSDLESVSSDSRSYEVGVRDFLGDLEDVQRELEWRRAGGVRS